MGVNGFARVVNKEVHVEEIPISQLKGQRLAVDLNNLVYRLYPSAKKEVVRTTDFTETVEVDDVLVQETALKHILRYLAAFLKNDVGIICCLDSKNHPRKQLTLEKRKTQKESSKEKLQELKTRMTNLQPLERHLLVTEYQKLLVNSNSIPYSFWKQLEEILSNVGYPVYKAEEYLGQNGDGEALVACLCINGYCYAGITNDSDFHMYGGNLAVYETSNIAGNLTLRVRKLDSILSSLQCSYSQFLDACILGGTDYNTGVRGVALKTALKLLLKVNWNVNNFPRCLDGVDYDEVLEIIKMVHVRIVPSQLDFDYERFQGLGEETLRFNNLTSLSSLYRGLINKLNEPSEEINLNSLSLI